MTRWVLHSSAEFAASHALTSYRGQPETPHSHRWQVAIRVGVEALGDEGYALDFHDLHAVLAAAVSPLEGTDLNAHPTIGRPSPTAEHLAEVLASEIQTRVADLGGRLLEVSVWEGEGNRVDLLLE
jgi:6-pyruvoyltetrahydropterin/6-carboxytetrahydropterin synthase